MKNLKIRNKILLPVAVLLILMTAGNVFQLNEMSNINDQSTEIADNWMKGIIFISNLDGELTDLRVNEYSLLGSKTVEDTNKYIAAKKENIENIEEAKKEYAKTITTQEEKKEFDEMVAKINDYYKISQHIQDLQASGALDQAAELLDGKSQDLYDSTSEAVTSIKDFNVNGGETASNLGDAMFAKSLNIGVGLMIVLLVLGIFAVVTLVKAIAGPVRQITEYMNYLAAGNLDKDVPSRELKDEIGDMARSVQIFKDNMVRAKELEAEQKAEELKKQARQEKINVATQKYEASMQEIVRFVSSSSTELQASAQSLAASAEETSKQSGVVAAAAQQAAANVQTVSSASEELSSSINEIAGQVARSSQVAGRAVEDARRAGTNVSALVDAARKIGEVTSLISSIAEQTNLLALNATIEAARAGEAGKGFAVVAAEVKNLATESTKATEEISSKILEIQTISNSSAQSINEICRVIEEIDEISGSISAAISEQTAATQEISRNVTEAYAGTSEVTQNIVSVNDAANDTGSASTQVLSAANELAQQSTILKNAFDEFIHEVKAA